MILRTKYSSEINRDDYDKEVVVAGWVQDVRKLGSIAFIQLRDRDGVIQVTALKKELNPELFKRLTEVPRESVISVKGVVKENKEAKAGFEILPKNVKIISVAKTPLPIGVVDKVSTEIETRFDHRFMDLRKPEIQSIFKIRHTMIKAVREEFLFNDFIEIHTPKIVATATEGGTNLFRMQYFEEKAFLNQSPQLYKQMMMATGLDRVFEIGPVFRAEEHDTIRHLNEFTSIDMEMAFADEEDVMKILEKIIQKIISMANKENKKELSILNIKIPVPETPFKRVDYSECVELIKSKNVDVVDGEDFSMEATKAIAEEFKDFYFITKWPTKTKPFYVQTFENNPDLCRAFDLMHNENEVTSGAQRVHDVNLLKERIREQGLNPENFKYYIEAFEYGMPPHAGWGLGVERMLTILTNAKNIRECVLFPRDRRRLIP
ncbi:MAG: aspartate--tRNA(Asn) ligase [Candidatus Thermoplasmatota archaeon]|nr:aspartate--tRNA(Asn) ligase [Candidatus Thermoplasmatota archaeon]